MSIITGTAASELLLGTSTADTITGGAGNDTIDGAGGTDVAVFSGLAAAYRFAFVGGYLRVQDIDLSDGDDGLDELTGITTLRFADRDYTIGTELRLNSTTAGSQFAAGVAGLAGGGTLMVWQSELQDGSGAGIFAQRLDAQGDPAGTEFQVNTATAGEQQDPVVAALVDGTAVVCWTSEGQDGSARGIYAQRFDASGNAVGAELLVNTTTAGEQYDPAVAALAGGGFVVTWVSQGQDGSGDGVYAQAFTPTGSKSGAEFRVNTYTPSEQRAPAITALGDGGFLVAWQSLNQDGSSYGVYAQRYNASAVAQGVEFVLNTTVSLNQLMPAVAGLAGGGFVATWASQNQDGKGFGIYAQHFDALGVAIGTEFRVNTWTASDQLDPAVVALAGGGYAVSWTSRAQDGSGFGVYAQLFDALGGTVGAEFRINDITTGHQENAALAALPGGGFAIAWQSSGQDGDGTGVVGQLYDATGTISGPIVIQGTPLDDVIDLRLTGALRAVGLGGDDMYLVNESGDLPIEDSGGGRDTVNSSVDWVLGPNFEDLKLTGAAAINATGNELDNLLTGNSADNVFDGGVGTDTMVGGAGNDTYLVDENDTITESVGNGTDTVISAVTWKLVSNLENLVLTGTGDIGGTGNSSDNSMQGNSGANDLGGGTGNDTLIGNGGDDTLNGGLGNDSLVGGAGDDTYVVDTGDIAVEAAGEGYDTVSSTDTWTLGANFEALALIGGAAIDGTGNGADNLITGNGAANRLTGAAGDDTLEAAAGDDTLIGGTGNDQLSGSGGADWFLFNAALSAVNNLDVVTDFTSGLDLIVLDDDIFTQFDASLATTLASGAFYKGAGITAAHDANDRIVYDTATGALYYDVDGLGGAAPVQFATLGTGSPPFLAYTDFLIVA